MAKRRWKVFAVVLTVSSVLALIKPKASVEWDIMLGIHLLSNYVICGYAFDRKVMPDKFAKPFAWAYTLVVFYSVIMSPIRIYQNIQAHRFTVHASIGGLVIGSLLLYFTWLAIWRYAQRWSTAHLIMPPPA